jgi:hypothetical protein
MPTLKILNNYQANNPFHVRDATLVQWPQLWVNRSAAAVLQRLAERTAIASVPILFLLDNHEESSETPIILCYTVTG